ncbi:hypothetical protein WICPIJ_007338 [Wickerhamomyces pijperi]|uniref:Uncharacterized protein n=1 Tax=Wickerhamomyces pijperi TaxID=599730 RepID=A0A9P8TJC8_WICPI|nr:hypothetical protein WICPIJ_007338 [Wickerhamomyces pijperi]
MEPFKRPKLKAFITKCSTSSIVNLVAIDTSLNEIIRMDLTKTNSTNVIKQIFCLKKGSDSFKIVDLSKLLNKLENFTKSPEFKEFKRSINHECSVPFKVKRTGCVNNSPKL